METTKINIEVSLSRNYDKMSLGLLDEPIEYSDDEDFKSKIKVKFALLRELVENEFSTEGKPQSKTESNTTSPQMISDAQKSFLNGLGHIGNMDNLTKQQASELIAKLKGN